jgi:hypothetical protein
VGAPAMSLRERLESWWNRMLERPRLSWEAAYVGCLLVVGVFGNPAVPFRQAPSLAVPFAQTAVDQLRDAVFSSSAGAVVARVEAAAHDTSATAGWAMEAAAGVASQAMEAGAEITGALRRPFAEDFEPLGGLRNHAGDLRQKIDRAVSRLIDAAKAVRGADEAPDDERREPPNL